MPGEERDTEPDRRCKHAVWQPHAHAVRATRSSDPRFVSPPSHALRQNAARIAAKICQVASRKPDRPPSLRSGRHQRKGREKTHRRRGEDSGNRDDQHDDDARSTSGSPGSEGASRSCRRISRQNGMRHTPAYADWPGLFRVGLPHSGQTSSARVAPRRSYPHTAHPPGGMAFACLPMPSSSRNAATIQRSTPFVTADVLLLEYQPFGVTCVTDQKGAPGGTIWNPVFTVCHPAETESSLVTQLPRSSETLWTTFPGPNGLGVIHTKPNCQDELISPSASNSPASSAQRKIARIRHRVAFDTSCTGCERVFPTRNDMNWSVPGVCQCDFPPSTMAAL
jgi:hypothetical protein